MDVCVDDGSLLVKEWVDSTEVLDLACGFVDQGPVDVWLGCERNREPERPIDWKRVEIGSGDRLGIVEGAPRSQIDQSGAGRLRQLLDQTASLGHELGDAGRGRGQHQAGDAPRPPRHVVDREPAAP